MDHDLDTALGLMARVDHPGLDGLDGAVFARIRAVRTSARVGLGATAIAAVGAIMLGVVAGPVASPAPAAPSDPLVEVTALAPSTLLMAER